MKVLYVTQTFPPEPGATARPFNQAIELQKSGCQVTILTTMPNYPEGRIYDGYRGRLFKKEVVDNLTILRFWSLPAPNKGYFLRMVSHLSFGFLSCIIGLLLRKFEVVIASVPNIGTELSGLMISKIRRSLFVLEERDLIPDNLQCIGIGLETYMSKCLRAFYHVIHKNTDVIAVPGISMVNCLKMRGVEGNKIFHLPHGSQLANPSLDKIDYLKDKLNLRNTFVVLYAGSFSTYYDVLNYVNAAMILQGKNGSIRFVLIGKGPDYGEAKRLQQLYDLKNVIFIGGCEPKEIPAYLELADVFISSCVFPGQTPLYLHDYIITKVAEYMFAGKPVISVEDGMMLGNIVGQNDVGAIVPCKKPNLLAEKIYEYYESPGLCMRQGKNARNYACTNLNRKEIVNGFLDHIKNRTHLKKRSGH